MSDLTTGTPKSNTLAQLSEWIWGQEQGWGPVIGLGHTNEGTAATFRFSFGEPTEKAELRVLNPGQTLDVPGKQELCRGTVFIQNALQLVAVFR